MRGGKREGAGRKPKAEEDRIRGFSLAALTKVYGSEQNAWNYIAEKSKESFPHLKLIFAYTYGEPKEIKEVNVEMQPVFMDE